MWQGSKVPITDVSLPSLLGVHVLGILEGVRIVRSGPQQSTCIDNAPKERDSYQHFHQDMTTNQVCTCMAEYSPKKQGKS